MNPINLVETADTLPPDLLVRWQTLISYFKKKSSVVVAYSGGVDSALLCTSAYAALGEHMLAVTIHSPVESGESIEAAKALASQVGFRHRIVEYNDLENPLFAANSSDRCYICKKQRFDALKEFAVHEGYSTLVEGSNADDLQDYRPGSKAVHELGIQSPLLELGFRKTEIREISKALTLSSWDRPAAPCLATRFPYGSPITPEGLHQISEGEAFMQTLGFKTIRVRHHGTLAKLEVESAKFDEVMTHRRQILDFFTNLGFYYVTVDLNGYRQGSQNEVLK